MGIGKILANKKDVKRIIGIDASTNSFAFCIIDSGSPVTWGEINFNGKNTFERIFDAGPKMRQISKYFYYDAIAIEPIVYVNNRSTVINLAYSMGCIISSIPAAPVHEYNPMEWQRHIGNNPLTAAEKKNIAAEHSAKSISWRKEESRRIRKERTKKWVLDTYGVSLNSDNVADAFGIVTKAWDTIGSGH